MNRKEWKEGLIPKYLSEPIQTKYIQLMHLELGCRWWMWHVFCLKLNANGAGSILSPTVSYIHIKCIEKYVCGVCLKKPPVNSYKTKSVSDIFYLKRTRILGCTLQSVENSFYKAAPPILCPNSQYSRFTLWLSTRYL